ncbi:hypothetical protein DSO57_1004166 [Entomophthora muscae]|uniref:Uncharacterized protein n=1 Tax=Entomophthora muscae TaxID=34485 RepID=A0ACC2UI64_9FUNG|nr:hypothetical protein DSO57_1004166 [Entomophthora muscae]
MGMKFLRIVWIAPVWGFEIPKLSSDVEFEQWRREIYDAVEDLELSRNGTSRNYITEKVEKIVASFFADAASRIACAACKVGIEAGTKVTKWDWTRKYFIDAINLACTKSAKKPKSVCQGIAHSSGNSVYEILRKLSANSLTKPMACYAFGNLCPMPNINIKRPTFPAKRFTQQAPIPGARYKRILHLSDLHYDRFYEEGAEANCNKPICCQRDSNSDIKDKTIKQPASKWGEYTCDANKLMLTSMLRKARSLYNYDMVFFTGDLPAHDMWKESYERTMGTEKEALDLLKQHFEGTPVYPVIGNHESIPVNQFPFRHMSPNGFYLYKFMAEQFKSWLGPKQLQMVQNVGYYSFDHSPALKVMVLNTNLYYTYNYFVLLNPANPDPNGMFSWMIQELQRAEDLGQKVYIAGHIPPGSTDFYQHWSESYHRIIERYAHIISSQFFGHLHTDEFEVFYNSTTKNKDTAISTAYLAPSMSTMNGINPSFRVYIVDAQTHQVVDYVQYYADLKMKHLWMDDMDWRPLYSARHAYSFGNPQHSSLTPAFWHTATELMDRSPQNFITYHRNLNANGKPQPTCDAACRKRTICTLRAGKSKDNCAEVIPFS